ncbi:MAG: DUF1302 family protein [Methanosarcinaceae archaeon]
MPKIDADVFLTTLILSPCPVYAQDTLYTIHVNSYKIRENAVEKVFILEKSGFEAFYRYEHVKGKAMWYRVYIGRFGSGNKAKEMAEELRQRKIISYYDITDVRYDIHDSDDKNVLSDQSGGEKADLAGEPLDFDFDMLLEETEPEGRIAEQRLFDFGGFIQATGALDMEDDKAGEHTRMVRNTMRLEGKWNSVQETTRLSHDSGSNFHSLASVELDYLWFGHNRSSEDCDIRLFEGYFYWSNKRVRPKFRSTPIQYGIRRYLSWLNGPVDISVGRQIVRWGKTDQISPVDNLNPQDLREFIIPDFEDRKIPNWMVRGRLFSDFLTLEGVYVPFFEPSRIDYFGTDWAIFQHMNRIGVHEEEPARNFKNGEGGIRVTKSVAGWDLGGSYLYAWEDLPYFKSFPIDGGDVQVTYKRSNIFGFEFETTVREIGLRGEAAYFDQQSFLTENFTSLTKPVLHYVIGADYLSSDGWYINLQFSEQRIYAYQEDILFFRKSNTAVSGEVSKEFRRGHFKALLRYNYGLSDKSYYLNPKIICTYFTDLDMTLGVNIFGGDSDTLLGLHDKDDQIFLSIKYHI